MSILDLVESNSDISLNAGSVDEHEHFISTYRGLKRPRTRAERVENKSCFIRQSKGLLAYARKCRMVKQRKTSVSTELQGLRSWRRCHNKKQLRVSEKVHEFDSSGCKSKQRIDQWSLDGCQHTSYKLIGRRVQKT